MLTRPPPLASSSPIVFFTGSDDKRDLFYVFLFSLSQYSFNVKKKKQERNLSVTIPFLSQCYYPVF